MQAKKQKVISVSPENRKKMMAAFQCSQTTVYLALRFVTHTKLAESIRQDALSKYGGILQRKLIIKD